MVAFLIWLAVAAALFAGLVFWRESHIHRRFRLSDLHLKAAILLAAVVALVPTFLIDHFVVTPLTSEEVAIPPGVAEEVVVPTRAAPGR
jgi:uncharacterized membrane protein (UPF0182 family)